MPDLPTTRKFVRWIVETHVPTVEGGSPSDYFPSRADTKWLVNGFVKEIR